MPIPFKIVRFIISFGLIVASVAASAQVYPVDGNITLTPPYSALLGQYTAAGSNNLMFVHTLRDASEPSLTVRYRLKIESSSIKLETKQGYRGTTKTLYPNTPQTIFGYDISDYFDINNLDISGISRQQLDKTKKLPEGQYQFCLIVLDDLTGVPISREACATAWIQLKDPPLVIAPKCGSTIIPQGGPNILFQWQNQGSLSANSAFSTNYELSVEEITDENVDPLNAIPNRKTLPIFTSTASSNTTYLYSLSDPTLDLGKRYVFRAKASDQNGLDEFKNDGYSQVCYFNYGYPEGGKLTVVEPKDKHAFAKKDQRYFKWSASNKMQDGQQVKYKLIITEITSGFDAKTAMANNTPWKEIVSSPTGSKSEYDMLLQDTFPKEKEMAWKVQAISGQQVVAESEVQSFKTPPAIEEFNAGSHLVSVNEITDKNLNSFAGKGQIKIGGTDSSWVDVSFSGLKIKQVAGRYVLDGGSISSTTTMDTIGLKAKHEDVPNGVFYPEEISLDKQALKLKGYVKIPLPLSTNSGTKQYVTTQSDWIAFDSYVLKGAVKLDGSKNTFSLLDPLGFVVKYNENSELTVSSNEFVLDLKGTLTLPTSVKSTDDKAVAFEFSEQNNFNYSKVRAIQNANIKLMGGSTAHLSLTEATLDFSEKKSPGNHASDKTWTGLYIEKSNLILPVALDDSKQMTMSGPTSIDASISQAYIKVNEVTGSGLQYNHILSKSNKAYASVNNFKGQIDKFDLKVTDSDVESGEFIADVVLPFVSNSKTYKVQMPVSSTGFGKAFFPQKITETVVFDEDDDQRKTEVKLKNLKFDNNGQVEMACDVNQGFTGLKLSNLNGLKLDAQGQLGFNAIGEPMALSAGASASMGGIPIEVDSIAFGEVKGAYGIALGASINLGPAASGEDGDIRTYLVSAVAPSAAVGAAAGVTGSYDAATGTHTGSANIGAGAAGNVGTVVGGSANANAGATGSVGPNGASGSAQAGATVKAESPMLNSLIDGVNSISGGVLKQQSYEAKVGAGAGGGVSTSPDGFKMHANVNLDVVVAACEAEVSFEVNQKWGAIMAGSGSIEGAFIKVKGLEGVSGQVIMGVKNGMPIALVRGGFDVSVELVPPYIALNNVGFAVGMHVSPETWADENFTPPSSMEWKVDMTTPIAVYGIAGIADGVPRMAGIVYRVKQGFGGRIQGIDLNNPSSYANVQLCGNQYIEGSLVNIASGPLASIFADKAAIRFRGLTDACYGPLMTAKGNMKADLMLTPGIPPVNILVCGEAQLKQNIRVDFRKIGDPVAFANQFLMDYQFGTEKNPVNVTLLCDPSMKLAKGWVGLKIAGPNVEFNTGLGVDIDKRLEVPKIKVPPLGDYVAPYFQFTTQLIGKAEAKIGLGNMAKPDPSVSMKLNVYGRFYTTAGAKYQILGKKGDFNLGKINVLVDGELKANASTAGAGINLYGNFEAGVGLLGKNYDVKYTGSLPLNAKF